jgi:NAD(P)-dependent dehydrogenase (short-subunit alcohol dehydrogenase family)
VTLSRDDAVGSPRLEGRVALVTGAGRGIGRAIALALARDGCAVAINDIDADPAGHVAAEIRDAGAQAEPYVASVIDLAASRGMVDAIIDRFGTIDILVSSAGAGTSGKSVLRTPIDEVDQAFRLHALAAFALVQGVLPAMRAGRRGDIIAISSTAVAHMPARSAPYSMAKSALEALVLTVAKEEAHHGIRAHVVAPGLTDTRLGALILRRLAASSLPTRGSDDVGQALRMASPDQIATAVVECVVDPRPTRTGQKITVESP